MSQLQHHVLGERDSEFSLSNPLLADYFNGTGGLVVISGPVGVGKTELLHRIVRNAVQEGALSLGANASRSERPVPLGVLSQVFSGPDLPSQVAESASRLLEDALLSASLLSELDDEATGRAAAPFMHKLTSLLLQQSESAPLVIGIDDVRFADIASLRCLLYLVHRIGKARVLIVVTESTTIWQPSPLLWAELPSQPQCRRVQLGLLSPERVAAVLAEQPGLPGSCEPLLCHQITGGNPRLLRALLGWALDVATEAGLLQGCRFRHEQARLAVLRTISEEERSGLHKRIAHLLYRSGAPAVAIARHKVAAYYVDAPWSTPVLCEAAEHALKEDDTSLALACLRLAERGAADEAQRASIRSGIVAVKWRLDPASAQRDVSELLHAARAGHVRGQHALALVNR